MVGSVSLLSLLSLRYFALRAAGVFVPPPSAHRPGRNAGQLAVHDRQLGEAGLSSVDDLVCV